MPEAKGEHELQFWREFLARDLADAPRLAAHAAGYAYFFTDFFGLAPPDYAGRRLLDIGCGPLGTLEWAHLARERVGLDPLADQYRDLVAHTHAMSYCHAPAEAIPYPDGYFDSVSLFNSLDHVDDVDRAIAEAKRVTKADGRLLLIVEIDHPPTATEPHRLDRRIVDRFRPQFHPVRLRLNGILDQYDLYGALRAGVPFVPGQPGLLSCRLEPRPAG